MLAEAPPSQRREAVEAFLRDLTRRGLQPDRVFWNTVIKFYAAQVGCLVWWCWSGWCWCVSISTFTHIHTHANTPSQPNQPTGPKHPQTPTDTHTHNTQGDEARAREAFQEMRRGYNIDPDAISYTTCIQACGRVRLRLGSGLVVVRRLRLGRSRMRTLFF